MWPWRRVGSVQTRCSGAAQFSSTAKLAKLIRGHSQVKNVLSPRKLDPKRKSAWLEHGAIGGQTAEPPRPSIEKTRIAEFAAAHGRSVPLAAPHKSTKGDAAGWGPVPLGGDHGPRGRAKVPPGSELAKLPELDGRFQTRHGAHWNGKIPNPCWNAESKCIGETLRAPFYGDMPVHHVTTTRDQWERLRTNIVERYLLRLEPLFTAEGYVCSVPSLRRKVRVVVDHPLLYHFARMILDPVGPDDTTAPAITVHGASGAFSSASTLDEAAEVAAQGDLRPATGLQRFFAVRGGQVVFCGSYNTASFREAIAVALAESLRGEALVMRSAVMARGMSARRGIQGPSLVVGLGCGRGDYSGHHHLWTSSGLSHVWYGASWDPRRELDRSAPSGRDLVEGVNYRATTRIPLDTPAVLEHPRNVIASLEFGTDPCTVIKIHRPTELAYTFLMSGGSPSVDPQTQYDSCMLFARLLRDTNCRFMSTVWGGKALQVAKKVAEGHALRGGRIGRPYRIRAEAYRRKHFPHIPCHESALVVQSPVPYDAAPGWQPDNR